jgi:hypothetical protein
MVIFLREQRRTALIDNLTKLSMPRAEAENYASFGDDLKRLDKTLSALVRRVGERCERLRETAHDDLRRRQCEAFLQADLYIYDAYAAEVNERHLPAIAVSENDQRGCVKPSSYRSHQGSNLKCAGQEDASNDVLLI